MESRQSRILGENVQLLAFVTIFFLPLAFSAVSGLYNALWASAKISSRCGAYLALMRNTPES
jgi:hypothetical protein